MIIVYKELLSNCIQCYPNDLDKSTVTVETAYTKQYSEIVRFAISRPLELIFKKSFLEGSVQDAWREANVTPIFKKGSKIYPLSSSKASGVKYLNQFFETRLWAILY